MIFSKLILDVWVVVMYRDSSSFKTRVVSQFGVSFVSARGLTPPLVFACVKREKDSPRIVWG